MEKIRKGNDIEVQWAIYAGTGINEAPYDLTGRNLSLYLKTQLERKEVYNFTIEKHVVRFMYWGKDQQKLGVYSIELVENEGREGMHTVDECDAFKLVSHSCETGGESEGRVECIHLQFRANMGISVPSIGTEITVDDKTSLTSENPVQNKVITLALQEEKQRAENEETRLFRLIESNETRLTLVEQSLELLEDSVQNIVTKYETMEDQLTKIEDAIEGVDLNAVAEVLTEVTELTESVEQINVTVAENSEAIEILNSDATVEGSVENTISRAAEWAAL